MGNRLSCSCAPLIRKAYRHEDTPWQNSRKRDGHLLRLWAEVFHVSTSSAGTVRWQQISEDLVPVNISCIQDHPDYVFHITAYNSQVDKILDVRLTQPGTRIGQASECFVYWKDPVTNDTWGLNFTSPADARAFRECCSPAFKFSRKASSSYSLRLESGRAKDQRNMAAAKRRTISTPASPSHGREPQCTCMTPEQYARLRAQDPRFRASMTLPRTQTTGAKQANNNSASGGEAVETSKPDKVSGANSSSSVYDNVNATAAKRSVETYATLRQARAAAAAAANAASGISDPKDDPNGQRGSATSATNQTSAASKNDGSSVVSQQLASHQPSQQQDKAQQSTPATAETPAHTQSVTTQTQAPPSGVPQQETNASAVASANLMPQQSITHRTQQPPTMYQYPPAFQQPPPYATMSQSYYNEMQGAIPRTYSQQQQGQYHGMPPSHLVNPHHSYYSPHVNYSHFGTLQPAIYRQDQATYHHQHHPYYQRAYSVQGYNSNEMPDHQRTLKQPNSGRRELLSSKSVDYSDLDAANVAGSKLIDASGSVRGRRSRSRSIEDMHGGSKPDVSNTLSLDSNALKRMLQPVQSFNDDPLASPLTSPEIGRALSGRGSVADNRSLVNDGFQSEPEVSVRAPRYYAPLGRGLNPSHANSLSRGFNNGSHGTQMSMGNRARNLAAESLRHNLERSLYLDFERGDAASPPSDNIMFDHMCYATTPSSSNGNSDLENAPGNLNNHSSTAASPTSRLLLEYEMHLRNTLAKGMDAESCSLHTFEALLTQSMENLESIIRQAGGSSCPGSKLTNGSVPVQPAVVHRRPLENGQQRQDLLAQVERIRDKYKRCSELGAVASSVPPSAHGNSNTLPLNLRDRGFANGSGSASVTGPTVGTVGRSSSVTAPRDREPPETTAMSRSFYSDRSDLERSGSLYAERDRGYLSDMSSRANSFYDRQDSVRSGYMSDRESRSGYGVVQQTSVESADSRLCYLTSSEMSDDDRLSLTTAVSDDDDGESESGTSPFRKSGAAASFNCTGAVRKAGFLSVKKWLLRKKHQVELARKRGWRGYWVCLKGTTLLFYPCDSREGRHVEAAPKHLIIVDGAIMQPIPEHPKRDFVFCLSTAFGDAYLFQAPCQAELDTWVNSIHSACAAAFARHRGKTGTLHLLQEEIFRLERSIESDNKLKHMAELQLSVVSEPENRRQIGAQISAWEENLERLHCEQFRLRCYMASLQHGELPNPKSLLTHVSRSTKNTLNRLGVFTVSSFHAYICARSPSLLNNLLAGRGATRRRTVAPVLSRSNSISSRKSQSISSSQATSNAANEHDKLFRVNLPDGQTATVTLKENMTVEEFLASACGKRGLNPAEHFVRVKKRRDMDNSNHFVPHRTDLIESYVPSHEVVEICTKALYQVELSRSNLEQMWGFSVEAELVENMERQDELCVFVSRVEDRSVAMNHGIIKGDEIMVINGALVGDLDMMYIESVLQEELSLCLMIRSCRAEPPDVTCLLRTTDDLIDSLVCPPPPSDPLITDDVISNLIVPAPSWNKEVQSPLVASDPPAAFPTSTNLSTVHRQMSNDQMVSVPGAISRPRMSERSSTSTSSDIRRSSPTGSVASSQSQIVTPNRQLSDGEKLKKCILELVETERTYVKHLNSLLENYLEPLKKETFLSTAEINALFGNIQEIVAFQRLFLQSLEEALALEPNFELFDQPFQFKNVLFAVGNAFLYHANHFKLYSSFCASHSKAQKVLLPNEGSQALQEFLQSRNPRQQHSSTLESYLIKPIQRILKYPLLLQQLRNLTDPASGEHQHLVEALKGMEKVAEHINEMQRIHEEYGAIFDHLFRQHQKSCKQPVDLSPGELLYYGGVEWLNISDFLGKVKKGLELHAMCFVFKSAVVFLCKERLRQKKKLMSVATKSSAPEVEIIRYQVLIPVTEVQVRTAQAKDVEAHYLWELIHLKNPLHRRSEKVYHLSNSTAEFRNAFLKTIRQIIRESVRNMSIPPAKPAAPIPPPRSASTVKQTARSGPIPSDEKSKIGMAQRHSAGNIDYDNLDTCAADQSPAAAIPSNSADPGNPAPFRGRSQTFGDGSGEKKTNRKSESSELHKDGDPGVKSESEDDPQPRSRPSLGRTPNHLSLSTTSTLSTGSSSSQARLVQVSRTPQSYTPAAKPLGSPVWKPRDNIGESFTLPRPGKSSNDSSITKESTKNTGYGTLGFSSKK